MSNSYEYFSATVKPEALELHDVGMSEETPTEKEALAREQHLTGLDALPIDEFLRIVGLRVRIRRSVLRMSRKRLAEVSGVSERYLAQLESGQGNMSITLLRKVTVSIGVTLSALLSAEIPEESGGSLSKQHSDAVNQSSSHPCASHSATGRSLNQSSSASADALALLATT